MVTRAIDPLLQLREETAFNDALWTDFSLENEPLEEKVFFECTFQDCKLGGMFPRLALSKELRLRRLRSHPRQLSPSATARGRILRLEVDGRRLQRGRPQSGDRLRRVLASLRFVHRGQPARHPSRRAAICKGEPFCRQRALRFGLRRLADAGLQLQRLRSLGDGFSRRHPSSSSRWRATRSAARASPARRRSAGAVARPAQGTAGDEEPRGAKRKAKPMVRFEIERREREHKLRP